MAFRVTSVLWAASRSLWAENSSDHISYNSLSTLRRKKKQLWFPTITLFRLSCTSERSTGVNHQPAFGQINQGSIKCCARACVCEDNEGHEVRQQGGRTGVFWGPELSKGPEGWLFHFLDTKERKKCVYIYRYIYIHTHTTAHSEASVGSQKLKVIFMSL